MKVYLDDERQTPEGWVRTYTVEETLTLLGTEQVSHLSLDNDLGENEPEGYTVLDKLEESVYFDPTLPIPIITVHSANPVRAASMKQVIDKLEKIRIQQLPMENKMSKHITVKCQEKDISSHIDANVELGNIFVGLCQASPARTTLRYVSEATYLLVFRQS